MYASSKQYLHIGGFTLIEMIVVVVIISIMVGATVLSVSIGDRSRSKELGKQITTLMTTLSNESILNGISYGLHWNKPSRTIQVLCFDAQKEKWQVLNGCPNAKQINAMFPSGSTDIQLPNPLGMIFTPDLNSVPFVSFGDTPQPDDEQITDDAVDDDNFQAEEKKKDIIPWVRFNPTGLWQPDGIVLLFIQRKPQIAFRWTATGRIKPVPYLIDPEQPDLLIEEELL